VDWYSRGWPASPPRLGAMRVYLGSDHAGWDLKAHLLETLPRLGYQVIDVGPAEKVSGDDYPAHCLATGERVVADPGSLGVVIGGSGNGEQIAANKVAGVRAALAWNTETARLSRQHNDANVVGIGARMHSVEEAAGFVETFLTTPFSSDERHARRIAQVAAYERTGKIE
jgi:ribose 5-phosphate isomerase B